MLQHRGQDNEQNFGPSQIDLIRLALDAVGIGDDCILDVQIHHVFGFKQEASNELAILGLYGNDSTLSVVQQHNWNTNAVISDDGHDVREE
jgi:hypothetical protein